MVLCKNDLVSYEAQLGALLAKKPRVEVQQRSLQQELGTDSKPNIHLWLWVARVQLV